MRVVIDANVFISGIINLNSNTPPNKILDLIEREQIELIISDDIISEISRVLHYPKLMKLHKLNDSEISEFMEKLVKTSSCVSPTDRINVSKDESDNRYLECGVTGGAEFIVTGDKKHLLPIKEYKGIKILSPTAFLSFFYSKWIN